MATISLEGMQFQGYHGVYDAERILGTTFVVDVHIDFDLGQVKGDNIETAINYEAIHHMIDLLMTPPRPLPPAEIAKLTEQELALRKEREPKKLIETVAQQIMTKLKLQFANMHGAVVKIKKMHPPLPGRVECSSIEVAEVWLAECPKCKKAKFACYKDANCWCHAVNVHVATQESLKQQYGSKCLCPGCLDFYVSN